MRQMLRSLKKYVTSHLPTYRSDLGHSKIFTRGIVEKKWINFLLQFILYHLMEMFLVCMFPHSCIHILLVSERSELDTLRSVQLRIVDIYI